MDSVRYWHHAESESVGIFDEEHLEQYEKGVGEPVDEIDEAQYLKLKKLYNGDSRDDHNNFYDNLEFAQRGEEEVADLLVKKLNSFKLKGFNEDKACDIVGDFRGREVTIEVKEDVRVKDTGNVVIEKESRGKPSGIITSTADFWVFRLHLKDGVEHYLFKLKDLRQAIRDRAFHQKRQMDHTDSCNVLYFFRVDRLLEYAAMKL